MCNGSSWKRWKTTLRMWRIAIITPRRRHMAVRAGHAEIVELVLDRGADPGQSRFTYNSWDKLPLCAREHGHRQVESLLQRAMQKRFKYTPDFDVLKEPIIARDSRKIGAV